MLVGLSSSSPAYHEADADGLTDLYVLIAIGLSAAVNELGAVLDEVLLDVEELCYLVGHFVYMGVWNMGAILENRKRQDTERLFSLVDRDSYGEGRNAVRHRCDLELFCDSGRGALSRRRCGQIAPLLRLLSLNQVAN